MSLTTVAFVARRIRTAETRWTEAMARPGYKDDPEEEGPFSETDWALWSWADAWRLIVHRYEALLDALPEAAAVRAERYSIAAQNPTIYEPLHSTESLGKIPR
jgi:hypothetical protein